MSANPPRESIGLLQLVGQSLSIGPLVDVALFLGIVASLAGAIGPLAVLLASLGMITFSLVVAFYAVETGGTGGVGDYIERAWGETVAALGEETTEPRRNIPIALVGTVSLTAVILVFCSYAGTIYYGPDHVAEDWGGVIDGYAVIAHEVVGPWAAIWIRLAVLVDFTATCIGFSLAASRGILSLARRGLLPAGLARTNRRGAPVAAATAILAAAVLLIAGGLLIPPDRRFKTLFVAGTAQALLLVVVYTGLALGALRLMLRSPARQPGWRWVVFPAAAVVPLLALYGTFVPFPDFPERYGLHAGMLTLGPVIVWAVRASSPPGGT